MWREKSAKKRKATKRTVQALWLTQYGETTEGFGTGLTLENVRVSS